MIPKPKYSNINSSLVNAFFLKYKKIFPDPLLYALALGIWTYNIFQDSNVSEIGADYSLIFVRTKTPLLVMFWSTASHYFNILTEKKVYEDISATHIEEFLSDLRKTTETAYLIINSLFNKIDRAIVKTMYDQYTLWVLGVLYGFYSDEYDKVAEMILQSVLPSVKVLRGEIKEEEVLRKVINNG
ncbi:hypothetical protein SBFV2_gp35 [Sulfolobales Beppu filamentous virus 2]|uniref:Uncharacterized protein n=1 Tax=Sulfolobales Beppu filamentous virus 2 TaxID=2493123 RepID=A0A3S8NF04_9VIRU|nr:hypothetical protein HOU84_gp35 [Sulfolobales Beppu filamentous virus 2]AZI75802.1 hypothetical protein SBFV2_gp35 [Sulfolobales Beppu filamentous virus 2]